MNEKNIKTLEIENFENISGYGIVADINKDKIVLGNSKILSYFNIENSYKDKEDNLAKSGNSIVYIAKNKEIIGIVGVNDILRENVCEIIEKLKKNRINVIMLTGDNKNVAGIISKQIGIKEVISDVLPSDKANIIKELKEERKKCNYVWRSE